ncbi:MAG: uncharacterized protein JWQ49_729 [Edaphobacter sp.]|nr:uncharacterized protein [Edaphobacter sp.]
MSERYSPQFEDKFIAFVDILGWKNHVVAAEAGSGLSLGELLDALKLLRGPQAEFAEFQPTICPMSARKGRDVAFCITQVSDCSIISTEVSAAGVISLVHHCWAIALTLLQKGLMCRGYITRGPIHHEAGTFVGSGYLQALDGEQNVTVFKRRADERGTPFIQVDKAVCDYAKNSDACVQEIFRRLVKMDGEIGGVFPFKTLSHSFMIGPEFDVDREAKSNAVVRKWITDMKAGVRAFVDTTNPRATTKLEHYLFALDEQLGICDSTDQFLQDFQTPIWVLQERRKNPK